MRIIPILAFCIPLSCSAEIFKRVDPITGHVTFTNISPRDSISDNKNIEIAKDPVISAASKPSEAKKVNIVARMDNKFPTVDAKTQKARDVDRKNILLEELNSEKQHLAEKIMKKSEPDAIKRVKANIASLEREILSVK